MRKIISIIIVSFLLISCTFLNKNKETKVLSNTVRKENINNKIDINLLKENINNKIDINLLKEQICKKKDIELFMKNKDSFMGDSLVQRYLYLRNVDNIKTQDYFNLKYIAEHKCELIRDTKTKAICKKFYEKGTKYNKLLVELKSNFNCNKNYSDEKYKLLGMFLFNKECDFPKELFKKKVIFYFFYKDSSSDYFRKLDRLFLNKFCNFNNNYNE